MKASVTELPFNNLLRIHPAGDAAHLLQLPSGDEYLNHLGTVHAAAQLALAEASSGEFLLSISAPLSTSFQWCDVWRRNSANPQMAASYPLRMQRQRLSLDSTRSFLRKAVR
jgi:hypothetical protein